MLVFIEQDCQRKISIWPWNSYTVLTIGAAHVYAIRQHDDERNGRKKTCPNTGHISHVQADMLSKPDV